MSSEMDELNPKEKLFQLWMIYSSKNDLKNFQEFVTFFIQSYQDLIDYDLNHLNEGFSEEGPHLTTLPDGILHVFSNHLCQCSFPGSDDSTVENLSLASDILKCLIVLCRNYDNVPLLASCEFVTYAVGIAASVVDQICSKQQPEEVEGQTVFIKLVLHFFECLYDPYFTWRKRLRGWNVDKIRLKFKPACLHVEVVPFFHDCFQKLNLPPDVQLRLLHVFGAIISGAQHNALKAITPATLDVLLAVLKTNERDGPTNEQRQSLFALKDLVLKCIVRMVHVIHCCSPDQRQVEVGQVMEGYLQVLLDTDLKPSEDSQTQLSMISAVTEMLSCHDKSALQVLLVSGGTLEAFISLLQKTSLSGDEAQSLAMSVLKVMSTVLAGSMNAKERFKLRVGYRKFVEALKSLGQPSMELLKAVLNLVVEGEYFEGKSLTVNNTEAAIMLIQWLPDIQSHDLQIWLSKTLHVLCGHGHNNKMNCCNDGMIAAILSVIEREKQINSKAVGHLIGLLESLGTHSVTAMDLKQLIGLLRLDQEEKQNAYCSRLMRAMSTMARREGKDGALYFFNLQGPTCGLALPGIRKWPGNAFSFHTWLCLDSDVDPRLHNLQPGQVYRRQLYSFVNSSGSGFESFVSMDGELVVAVYNKREYNSVSVTECGLTDSHWHSIAVVHSSSRRPFVQSQLYVYIDGRLKLNAQLKFPNVTEPITSCRVGTPGIRSSLDIMLDGIMAPSSPTENKKVSPLKLMLQGVTKSNASQPGVDSLPFGTQDEMWGPPIVIHGQIGSVCLFHDVVQPNQVKAMYTAGPNSLALFNEDSELSDLPGKLLLHYNAKACKGATCVDLSVNQNHGQLVGQKCVTWDIKDVINCIGGIQLLFPLLEQVNMTPVTTVALSPITPGTQGLMTPDSEDWVVIPSSSYADTKLEQNQVAGFLTMLRHMIHTVAVNQDMFVSCNCAATVGALLQKVNPKLIDVHVLMAVQLLIESMGAVNKTLLNHLYQYILFDFRIWSRSDFPVRIGHIQYLSTIIKDDRRYFRKKFGVQFILDVIRSYYNTDCGLSEEDSKTVRVSLLGLVKYYIAKDVTAEEVSQLVNFLLSVKEENMLLEALDLLISMLDMGRKQDQLYLLLFEPDMAEMLYGLLTYRGYTIIFYEKVVKVLHILLKTDKVYDKNKNRLRLLDCGYLGLIGLMEGCEISGPTIKRFMELVSFTDQPHAYNSVLAVLQLVYNSGFDIKLEASKRLLTILVSKNGAAKQFAKQLGWQESITKLLTLNIIGPEAKDLLDLSDPLPQDSDSACILSDSVDKDLSHPSGDSDSACLLSDSGDKSKSTPNEDSSHTALSSENLLMSNNCNSNQSKEHVETPAKPCPPSSLDLNSGRDPNVLSPFALSTTPSTPMYLKALENDDLFSPEDVSRSMSRSSSASAEDLSAISQKAAERKAMRHSGAGTSLSLSESGTELSSVLESHRNSLATSAESLQQALDSLGLQSFVVKDSGEITEELTQNLLIVLLTVMWKGVEGSSEAAWKERYQVFSWIDHLSETYDLIRPPTELKRRLLEMMIHTCCTELREGSTGQVFSSQMENAAELVRLVKEFVTIDNPNSTDNYSERLIEDVMGLLDTLSVWDVGKGVGWQEMVHLGLSILLTFTQLPKLELCSLATARLHNLVQTKLISSSAEAAFLIGSLNTTLLKAVEDGADNYSFLIPVLKALIDKVEALLNLDMNLPSLPLTSGNPTFFDDFKKYCKTEEWQQFMDSYVNPQKAHFEESVFEEISAKLKETLSASREEMMVNMHKRNRERGESKLKFQSQILEVFERKSSLEERRFQNVTTQQRNQHFSTLRQWRATKRFFTGERGAWAEGNKPVVDLHWKLSNQENFSRMKVKLIPNYNFDLHIEASLLRDNLGEIGTSVELENLSVAKEALVSKENIGDDAIGDEEWNVISSSSSSTEEYHGKEKLVLSEECEFVTLVDVIKGRLEVTTTHVYFFDCSSSREEGGEDFKWSLSQLREIHFRRYNLRRSALEMFLIDQTNYFLNFEKKMRNKVYSKILSLRPPNLIYYGSRSPAELLKASGLVQKWVHREISNFEYLMQLNTIAGRTYNDLSQYPVFPWILCDYTSETLDLENPAIYRDLSKPMGVVNARCEEEVKEKYDHFEDPSGVIEKFHYGTHYSNSAGVMHFMIRMEPFTTLHIELQSGRFDVADRQFYSIPSTWQSIYENPNDVKELIPEFFYLPEFLINCNGFDLGKLQITKDVVGDVALPNWAESPEDFIHKHRKALESEHVSNNLHQWIDLIFGYKQKGPAAVEALNVFYYCTYEGAVDLDAVKNPSERKALEGMINNFGQTPCQLLKDPHPKRLTLDEVVTKATKINRHLSVFLFLEHLKVYFVEVSAETDPLVYVTVPRNQTRSIIQHGMPDTMVTVTKDGIIGSHGWLAYDKSISNYFTFEKDPATNNQRTRKKLTSPFAPGLRVEPKLFVVSHDAKLLFSGGHWDNSLQVFHLGKGKIINYIVRHIDIVTCLSLDYCGSHLITGSRDTTCNIWQVLQQGGVSQNISTKPLQTLYGHDAEVTAVHISIELDMAVSAAKDGTVIIHTVRKGHYMRSLRPPCEPSYVMNIPMLAVDEMGHIVVYCEETFPIDPKEVFSLHLYSLNGKHLFTERLQNRLGHMIIKGDYLISGDFQGQLIVRETFGLKELTNVPLYVPIHSLAITNGNSHVLAGLRDGKLIIIGIKSQSEIR